MSATSNSFHVLGTNSTGSSVVRTMTLENGQISGVLSIAYKALSTGPLKWNLEFTPNSTAQYRFVYHWNDSDITPDSQPISSTLTVSHGAANYTLSWDDVPPSMNTTLALNPGEALLITNIGTLVAGATARLDPQLLDSGPSQATAHTPQRKAVYDSKGGYYYVFYYDGMQLRYASSNNGVFWASSYMPNGWPSWNDMYSSPPSVYNSGPTIIVATGMNSNPTFNCQSAPCLGIGQAYLYYAVGISTAGTIAWESNNGQIVQIATAISRPCYNTTSSCSESLALRNVSVAFAANGNPAFSYNFYASGPATPGYGVCNTSWSTESDIGVTYVGRGPWFVNCENDATPLWSEILPADAQASVRVVYEYHNGQLFQLQTRTIGGTYSTISSLNPAADTTLERCCGSHNQNLGTSRTLTLTAHAPNTSYEDDILVRFAPNLPTGAMVTGANLTFTVASARNPPGTGVDNVSIAEASSAWNEYTATYDYQPGILWSSYSKTPNVNFGSYTAGQTLRLDVTNAVRGTAKDAWSSQGAQSSWTDNGFFLWLDYFPGYSPTNPLPFIDFSSREGSSPPTLSIGYLCCMGPVEVIDPNQDGSDQFSAAADSTYGTHVVYNGNVHGNITYAYRSPTGVWSYSQVASSPGCTTNCDTSPSITVDWSTNDIYIFASLFSIGGWVLMRHKTLAQNWQDTSWTTVTVDTYGHSYLVSNLASATGSNSSSISLVWTESNGAVMFASIPIGNGWSPFINPNYPWDGNGVVPYGQYFHNEGEYVSTSTGLLTAEQTDMSVPGRGLDFSITRVYVEPSLFIEGTPSGYESYPWAPLEQLGSPYTAGTWQLNFPWMSNAATPLYIHLWNGEGYRIPSTFWFGLVASFENRQGEQFRMVRNTDNSTVVYDKTGTAYNFNPTHALTNIVDLSGNTITFMYSGNMVSCVTDTVSRAFLFSYANGLLSTISQVSGTCTNPGNTVKTVLYYHVSSNGNTLLTAVADPMGRTTGYQYQYESNSQVPYLLTRITYPTQWHTDYAYASSTMGTEGTSYRVVKQWVGFGPGTSLSNRIREVDYSYTNSPGGQVSKSEISLYNGTSTSRLSFTDYSFSFASVAWNVTDDSHGLLRGTLEYFSAGGEVAKEIVLVTDGGGHLRSYTNYYQYDAWGNMIYSRQAINAAAGWYHERFNAYYNNGLPPGFNAFQDTFSASQGTASDNSWAVNNGAWLVNNGSFNGTQNGGPQEGAFASASIGKSDISLQANIYITRQSNTTTGAAPRVGLFVHYPGTGTNKWALVLIKHTDGTTHLDLFDEWGQMLASPACTIVTGIWYTFNMTVHGTYATGWASAAGQPSCPSVSGNFSNSSPAISGTGFGLYAGGYSALFDNVQVATVSPYMTGTGFSNSFINNGAPMSSVHGALAGTAQLQNSTGPAVLPIESYFSYNPSGEPIQTRQIYDSATGTQWLTTSATYDGYGNLVKIYDSRGNATYFSYSTGYQRAYLTNMTQTVKPGNAQLTSLYNYNFTDGTLLSTLDPRGYNTTYNHDLLGRLTKETFLATGDYTTYTYNDNSNYVNITNEMGWKTRQFYDGLGRLSNATRLLNGVSTSAETYTYNAQGEIAAETDPLGNRITYQYDGLGRVTRVTQPDMNSTSTIYNDLSFWTRTTDQNGVGKCSILDQLGRLISVVENASSSCLSGTVTNYYYDEVGNLVKTTAANLQSTIYAYDNLNRLVKTTYPDGTTESYAYDSNGNLSIKTERNGVAATYSYDSMNRLMAVVYSTNRTAGENYTYDNNGNVLSLQSLNGTVYYSYDGRNSVLSETYVVNPPTPDFTMSSISTLWVAQGSSGTATITLQANPGFAGTITLSTANLPTGATSAFTPGSVSLTPNGIATVTLRISASSSVPLGSYTVTAIADSGNTPHSVTFTVKVITGTVSFTQSAILAGINGTVRANLTVNTATSQSVVGSISRTATNSTTHAVLYNDAISVSLSFGTAGTLGFVAEMSNPYWLGYGCTLDLTKANGNPSCSLYRTPDINRDGQINIQDLAYVSAHYNCTQGQSCYDPTADVNADGSINLLDLATVSFYLNYPVLPPGDLTVNKSPASLTLVAGSTGSSTITVTSVNGLAGTVSLSAIVPTVNGLSAFINPPTVSLGSSGTSTLTVSTTTLTPAGTYNVILNASTPGLVRATSLLVTVSSTLPNLSCPSPTAISSASGKSYTYTVGYCYRGEVLDSLTYPDGTTVRYGYDGLGRTLNVTKSGSASSYASFTYNRNGQVTGVTLGNGLTESYSYNKLSMPSTMSVTNSSGYALLSLAYKYNPTGTASSVLGTVNGQSVNEQYQYDQFQRLTNATITSGGATTTSWYTYDALGNRVWQSVNGTKTSYTDNHLNELTRACVGPSGSNCASTNTYNYDANGNQNATTIGGTAWIYTWSPSGYLTKVSNSQGTQGQYAYDANGRRVESIEAATTTFYSYTGTSVLFQCTASGTSTDYIFAGGMEVARLVSGSTTYYYHTDALGSTRLVTDANGHGVFSTGYQPYGQNNGTPTGSEILQFTGMPYSSAIGLYYDYERWYDQSTGRFISQDPVHGYRIDPQSLNLYIYTANSPTSATDRTGLDCYTDIFSLVGCAANSLYDDTIGAGINSYNWYQTASDKDRMAFWYGIGAGVAVGVGVGALCAATAGLGCVGAVAVLVGIGVGIGGGVVAGEVYTAAGGTSEGGLRASRFWGGIGSGFGFGIGFGVTTSVLAQSEDASLVDASFASRTKLLSHWIRHGLGMGDFTPGQYLGNAQSLIEEGFSGDAELWIRGSGTDLYAVEPGTGRFAVYNPVQNIIRTYMDHPGGSEWIETQIRFQGWVPFPI